MVFSSLSEILHLLSKIQLVSEKNECFKYKLPLFIFVPGLELFRIGEFNVMLDRLR